MILRSNSTVIAINHESIGKGYIFNEKLGGNMDAFYEICKIAVKYKIPMILETPNSSLFKKRLEC